MANASIGWNNYIDLDVTTFTGRAALPSAPFTNLKNPHVGKKWRDNASTTFVVADLGSAKGMDAFMLAGVSGVLPTFRVRMSNSDSTGAAGEILDSGSVSGVPYWDANYGMFCGAIGFTATARYVRVDISEGGVSYIEAGRMYVGPLSIFTRNFIAPWSRSVVRRTTDIIGEGGQTYTNLRQGYRKLSASFDFITQAERDGFIESISVAIAKQGHKDMLWIKDTQASAIARDALWGYIDGEFATTQKFYAVPAVYSVEFAIRERL